MRERYKVLAKELHPDKVGGRPDATEAFGLLKGGARSLDMKMREHLLLSV